MRQVQERLEPQPAQHAGSAARWSHYDLLFAREPRKAAPPGRRVCSLLGARRRRWLPLHKAFIQVQCVQPHSASWHRELFQSRPGPVFLGRFVSPHRRLAVDLFVLPTPGPAEVSVKEARALERRLGRDWLWLRRVVWAWAWRLPRRGLTWWGVSPSPRRACRWTTSSCSRSSWLLRDPAALHRHRVLMLGIPRGRRATRAAFILAEPSPRSTTVHLVSYLLRGPAVRRGQHGARPGPHPAPSHHRGAAGVSRQPPPPPAARSAVRGQGFGAARRQPAAACSHRHRDHRL